MKYNKFTAIEIIQESDIPRLLPFFQSINPFCNKITQWTEFVFFEGVVWYLDPDGNLRCIGDQKILLPQYTIIKGIPDDWQPEQEDLQQSKGVSAIWEHNQSNSSLNSESLVYQNRAKTIADALRKADFDFDQAIKKSNQNMEQKNKIISELISLGDNLTTGTYSEETLNVIIPFINLSHRAKELIK